MLQINAKKTVVCSRHFKPEDYKWSAGPHNGRRLKKGVIPSVFPWTANAKDKPERFNPMDKVRLAQEHDFQECDISDDDNDNDSDKVTDTVGACEKDSEIDIIRHLNNQLKEQEEHFKQMLQDKDNAIAKQKKEADKTVLTLVEENETLKQKLEIEKFGVSRFGNDDSMIRFYTGFVTYAAFLAFYNHVKPSATNMQSCYYKAMEEVSGKYGRPSCMKLIDELFMFLCRLRVGFPEVDLANRFNCSLPTVSRKIITWSNLLYVILGSWNVWLSRETIAARMPKCFHKKFASTRVIIDCTEVKTQIPKSLVLNSQLYSHYKGANTLKCLIGIAPHGAVTFVSSLYTGCMSDVEITKLCGIIDLLEEGDTVMADKGFTIEKLVQEKSASLNIPPFLQSCRQFTPSDVSKTQEIAAVRIHVERAIARIKTFHLFSTPIPLALVGTVNQLWTVAALLTNFQGPLIIE